MYRTVPFAAVVLLSLSLGAAGQEQLNEPYKNIFFKEFSEKMGIFPQRVESGNPFAEKKFKAMCEDYIKTLPGKKVRWDFKITQITEEYISFAPIKTPQLNQNDRYATIYVFVNKGAELKFAPNPQLKNPEFPPRIDVKPTVLPDPEEKKRVHQARLDASPNIFRHTDIKTEVLENLSPDDRIVFKGEIAKYTNDQLHAFPVKSQLTREIHTFSS